MGISDKHYVKKILYLILIIQGNDYLRKCKVISIY